jgi:hypothetical protein
VLSDLLVSRRPVRPTEIYEAPRRWNDRNEALSDFVILWDLIRSTVIWNEASNAIESYYAHVVNMRVRKSDMALRCTIHWTGISFITIKQWAQTWSKGRWWALQWSNISPPQLHCTQLSKTGLVRSAQEKLSNPSWERCKFQDFKSRPVFKTPQRSRCL